jgi:hypothetical protein
MVAVWVLVTAAAVAVNDALDEPEDTVTDAGTVRAVLLLLRFTPKLPLAALLSVTVQFDDPEPVNDDGEQPRLLRAADVCRVSDEVRVTPLSDAVIVAVESLLKLETAAVKLAVVAAALTVTLAGTLTTVELSLNVTDSPPAGAAAVNVTVQLDEPAALNVAGVQLRMFNCA